MRCWLLRPVSPAPAPAFVLPVCDSNRHLGNYSRQLVAPAIVKTPFRVCVFQMVSRAGIKGSLKLIRGHQVEAVKGCLILVSVVLPDVSGSIFNMPRRPHGGFHRGCILSDFPKLRRSFCLQCSFYGTASFWRRKLAALVRLVVPL